MTVLHRLSSLAAGQTATVQALHVDSGFQSLIDMESEARSISRQ